MDRECINCKFNKTSLDNYPCHYCDPWEGNPKWQPMEGYTEPTYTWFEISQALREMPLNDFPEDDLYNELQKKK